MQTELYCKEPVKKMEEPMVKKNISSAPMRRKLQPGRTADGRGGEGVCVSRALVCQQALKGFFCSNTSLQRLRLESLSNKQIVRVGC
jgi:hypothetical protein